jgi:hypothetical protein
MVPVHAQEQYSVSTDKLVYNVGENVTIYISPAPPNGFVNFTWMVYVTKPDQSRVSPLFKLPLAPGSQAAATLVADIVGQYRVDLVFEKGTNCTARAFVMCDLQVMATCYFQAGENQSLKFIPIAAAIVLIAAVVLLVLRTRKKKIKEEYLKGQDSEEDANHKQSVNSGVVTDLDPKADRHFSSSDPWCAHTIILISVHKSQLQLV